MYNRKMKEKTRSSLAVQVYLSVLAMILASFVTILYDNHNKHSAAFAVIDVYRLAQFDISGVPYGSRQASFKHTAVSSLFSPRSSSIDPELCVLVLPIRELNISFLQDYVEQKKPIGSVLLLLPPIFGPRRSVTEDITDHDIVEKHLRNTLLEVERLLMHANIPYPVYFGFEDETINDVLADLKNNDATGQPASEIGGYKLEVSVREPKKVESPSITNIQGWLPGQKPSGNSADLPTIAIVASYDTFGSAPALSVGSDSNGSGVVALIELYRIFSTLYKIPKTRGGYNLLFVLTSGGPYNYIGTQKWLWSLDQQLRESIDYAICLNSIGSSGKDLWFHVSEPPENAHVKHIFEGFTGIADKLGLKINLKHKKINISNPRVAWEHEQFSKVGLTAATLSGLPTAPEFLERVGSISDNRRFISEVSINRNVKIIAESLKRHIYGEEGKHMNTISDINPLYITMWLHILLATPRVAPFLSKKDLIMITLNREFDGPTANVTIQYEVLDGMFTFYDSTRAKLKIYKVTDDLLDRHRIHKD